jgi:microcystin-dependent protein
VFPYGANTNGSGGSGSTHFVLPNLKGRVPVGRDSSQTEFDTLGETGGAKTHTLTEAQMPSHLHSVDPPSANFTSGNESVDHSHTFTTTTKNNAGYGASTGNVSADHAHGITAYEWITRIPSTGSSIRVYSRNSNADQGVQQIVPGSGGINTNHTHADDHAHTGSTSGISINHQHTTAVNIAAFNSASAGSGQEHNNLQPYIVINYIVKT